jgi:hypothetical protein
MTLDQIIRETRQWPASQVDQLIHALTSDVAEKSKSQTTRRSSLQEYFSAIDALWADSDVNISADELVAAIRESRE